MATAGRLGLKDPAVIDLAMWKNPRKSGAVLGGATALYVLFELSTYTLIEMMSTAALVFILASSLWSFVAVHLGRDGMPLPPFVKEGISDEAARKLVIDKALPELNKALALVAKLAKAEDIRLNGKVAAALLITAKIGHFFSVLTSLYLGLVVLMVVPKVYDTHHEQIDKAVDQAMTKLKELKALAHEKLKPLLEKLPKAKAPANAKSE
uniref:Reticulon-like protein n=1 Tax=Tetraselmis sp. GSL018 TaxID=582737 RepID=A0A061R311_9CHLO